MSGAFILWACWKYWKGYPMDACFFMLLALYINQTGIDYDIQVAIARQTANESTPIMERAKPKRATIL